MQWKCCVLSSRLLILATFGTVSLHPKRKGVHVEDSQPANQGTPSKMVET